MGVDLKDKVCLIHAPMSNKKMNELYTVSYLGNVVGGQIINYANVEIDIEQPTTAQVSVYDMLGRTYYSQTFTLVKGKNNLVLDISDINMAQGMYTVKVQGDNLNKNIVWLMK